ncbi:hypothetical protein [Ruegeria sp. HKCCA6707]|uniref:hypothetical protein n=1 Tax=Ruegeria sp. HKCCA6707 TaxID=2682996 RepID=UPI0014896977|nr:hypothetical protein [Ruegeria sp. HKCCA6707]
MTIKNRLKKLETASHTFLPRKILFTCIVPAKDGRQSGPSVIHHAIIAGTNLGQIMRSEGESELEFKRRAYAAKTIGKRVEEMTDAERAKAFEIAAQELRDESNAS